MIRRFEEDCRQFDENVHTNTARVTRHILIDTSFVGHKSTGKLVRCGSINKVALLSQIDDAPQNDDPVQAETLPYLRTRPTYFTAGNRERSQDDIYNGHDLRPNIFKKLGAFVSPLRVPKRARESIVYEEEGRECVV